MFLFVKCIGGFLTFVELKWNSPVFSHFWCGLFTGSSEFILLRT